MIRRRLRFRIAAPFLLSALLLAGCAGKPRLKAFASDGCSLFPDRDYLGGASWCACCIDHDHAYWKGGSDSERLSADSALGACVRERTGDKALAETVYRGVRAGGSEYFPNGYRWGYGWPYFRRAIPDSVRREETARREPVDLASARRTICKED